MREIDSRQYVQGEFSPFTSPERREILRPETLKCLTIRQPWAGLIASGWRPLEVRRWQTNFRGPLLIHAGKKIDRGACRDFGIIPVFGAIIGLANLVGVEWIGSKKRWEELREQHLEDGTPDHFPLCIWRLKNPLQFKDPIPWKGRLGLFDIPLYKIGKENLADIRWELYQSKI